MPLENAYTYPCLAVPAIARAPFNDPSLADLILRSNDKVDFYVFRGILMVTSPIFRDMVAVSGDAISEDELMKDGLRVVVMHESSAPVLDALLRYLYPMPPPVLDDFGIILCVVSAAKKYEMEHVLDGVKTTLSDPMWCFKGKGEREGERVMGAYLVASSLGWKTLSQSFAQDTLHYALDETWCSWTNTDRDFSSNIRRLLTFRRRVEEHVPSALTKAVSSITLPYITDGKCCFRDKDFLTNSPPWLKWRLAILPRLTRAPLATELAFKPLMGRDQHVLAKTLCASCAPLFQASAESVEEHIRSTYYHTIWRMSSNLDP